MATANAAAMTCGSGQMASIFTCVLSVAKPPAVGEAQSIVAFPTSPVHSDTRIMKSYKDIVLGSAVKIKIAKFRENRKRTAIIAVHAVVLGL
eukprot:scaffold29934_cov80-Skeletonema_marinoi.AAC.1